MFLLFRFGAYLRLAGPPVRHGILLRGVPAERLRERGGREREGGRQLVRGGGGLEDGGEQDRRLGGEHTGRVPRRRANARRVLQQSQRPVARPQAVAATSPAKAADALPLVLRAIPVAVEPVLGPEIVHTTVTAVIITPGIWHIRPVTRS